MNGNINIIEKYFKAKSLSAKIRIF